MWFGVVSSLPNVIKAGLSEGVVGRAVQSGILGVDVFDVREHATNDYGAIDDRPFGGAPGMLMMAEPLAQSVEDAVQKSTTGRPHRVLLSAQGEQLEQSLVTKLAEYQDLVLVCGRYEGVDERFIDACIDREVSVGDYVVSGGELPALIVIDAVGRLLEGTLGNANSAFDDSFDDNLLEGPQYTRPRKWRDRLVPEVLTSGNHGDVAAWRRNQALLRTWQRRPELLTNRQFTSNERDWLKLRLNEENSNRR